MATPAPADALAAVLDRLEAAPPASAAHPRIPAAVLVALIPAALPAQSPLEPAGSGALAAAGDDRPPARLAPRDQVMAMRVVLTVRRPGLRRHAGEVAFPGGRWDPADDSLYETALREAEEEIGLHRSGLSPIGALGATGTIATNYSVQPFVAILTAGAGAPPSAPRAGGPAPAEGVAPWTPSRTEVAAILEPTLAELAAGSGRARLTRRGLTFETDVYRLGEHLVWGLTARVIADLLARVAAIAGSAGADLGAAREP